jgi:hypothetical protein
MKSKDELRHEFNHGAKKKKKKKKETTRGIIKPAHPSAPIELISVCTYVFFLHARMFAVSL